MRGVVIFAAVSQCLLLAIDARPKPDGHNPWYPGTFEAGARYGPDLDKCDWGKYASSGCKQVFGFDQRICGFDSELDADTIAKDQDSTDGPGGCPTNHGGSNPTPGFNQTSPMKGQCWKHSRQNECLQYSNSGCHWDSKSGCQAQFGCYCLHKHLFPMTQMDVIGSAIFMGGVFVASSAGIGGGGLNVPFFILFFGFLIAEAIPLSHAAVMANSVAQFIVNFRSKHPEANRPVTDYFAPLILLPAQLGGNNIGVVMGSIFPKDVLILLSIVLLVLVTTKVAYKGINLLKKELEPVEEGCDMEEPLAGNRPLTSMSMDGEGEGEGEGWEKCQLVTTDDELNERARKYLQARRIPDLVSVGILLLLWAIFSTIYVLLKEAKTCSTSYWLLLAALYPILIGFTALGAWWLLKDQKVLTDLVAAGAITPLKTEVIWSFKTIGLYGSISVAVGFVGGILGLGGAEFMAPLMLEMGMAPPAAAATAAYMNLFTSASNLVHYSQIPGVLPPNYTAWFCCTGFLAGFVGRNISASIAASGKQSVVILALATVLGVSAALLGWRGADSKSDWVWHTDQFC